MALLGTNFLLLVSGLIQRRTAAASPASSSSRMTRSVLEVLVEDFRSVARAKALSYSLGL